MAKTELTRQIESALMVWAPTHYAGMRVDQFRDAICAREVPVECGSIKGGLIDYACVQECFVQETKVGTCKLAVYRDADKDLVWPDLQQELSELGCPNEEYGYAFRTHPCPREVCRYHKTGYEYTVDTVIACVEIKISVEDFHSPHGHNFCGHCNYYAMPKSLYAKVKDEIPEDIGVLLYYDGTEGPFRGIRKKKECVPHELNTETQKWLIMSIAKRATKELRATIAAKEKQDRYDRCHSSGNAKY